jgi:hypothetical protein
MAQDAQLHGLSVRPLLEEAGCSLHGVVPVPRVKLIHLLADRCCHGDAALATI